MKDDSKMRKGWKMEDGGWMDGKGRRVTGDGGDRQGTLVS